MPRLNPAGDWCAGIGGGVVTVNGTVIASNAGGACWLDPFRVLYQHGAHLETFDIRTGEIVVVDHEGATELAAGGGVYAAKLGAVRVSNRSERYPDYGVGDVGPDGSVLLKTPDGLFQGRYVSSLQALGGGSWSGLDEHYRPICSPGVPPVVPVEGRIYGLRRAGRFCCYQAEQGARFIVQWVDRPVGTVVAIAPTAFRPDLVVLPDGRLKVTYAETEGEAPASVRTFIVHPSTFTELTKPDPPPPDKDDEPEKPTMRPMPPIVKAVVYELYTRHLDLARGDDDQRRALMKIIAEQVSFELGPNWGTKRAGEGRPPSKDAIAYWDGTTVYGADCFNGATREPSVPDVLEPLPGQVFIAVQPVNHLGSKPPKDDDPPKPDPEIGKLRADVKALREALGEQEERIADLLLRVTTLEAKPDPVFTLPKLRVKGSTSRQYAHGHAIDLPVVVEE